MQNDDAGKGTIPLVSASRRIMQPKVNAARRYLERHGHLDLEAMIFGEETA